MDWLAGSGARREFDEFVAGRTDPLLRTAYLMVGDVAEAQDLVQETLLAVARRWHRVRAMAHPAAYARRVLVGLVLDGRRERERRSLELSSAAGAEPADGRAERDLAAVDAQQVLAGALLSLPARQRAVIVLRYWEDLPEAEVAAALGCSPGTVKSTASRGLARLREALGGSLAGAT